MPQRHVSNSERSAVENSLQAPRVMNYNFCLCRCRGWLLQYLTTCALEFSITLRKLNVSSKKYLTSLAEKFDSAEENAVGSLGCVWKKSQKQRSGFSQMKKELLMVSTFWNENSWSLYPGIKWHLIPEK